jgi:hypothetical protein
MKLRIAAFLTAASLLGFTLIARDGEGERREGEREREESPERDGAREREDRREPRAEGARGRDGDRERREGERRYESEADREHREYREREERGVREGEREREGNRERDREGPPQNREDRIGHIRAAIHHLQSAGMHDLAHMVMRTADQQFRGPDRGEPGRDLPPPPPPQLGEGERRGVPPQQMQQAQQMQQMHRVIGHLQEQLHHMQRELGELRGERSREPLPERERER